VIDVDLFTQGLNFVFEASRCHPESAVISLYRLRQEFCGLPPDEDIFRQVTLKEAVHEWDTHIGLGTVRIPRV